jgi:tetratricopeptide (TPR) repeat protein
MKKQHHTLPPSSIALLACAGAIALVHVWGALARSHDTWGAHLFGFLPWWAGAAAAAIVALMAVPQLQSRVLRALEGLVQTASGLPVVATFLAAAGLVVGGAYLFPARLHLLGDGALLIRSIPRVVWGDEVAATFKNQPLLNIVYKWAVNFHPADQPPHPDEVYFVIDLAAAVLFLFLLFWGCSKLQRPNIERFLLGLLLFAGAGAQFFFGYVENYVLQYVVTAAYAVTGWYALERKVHIAVPLALFALLPGLNLGTLIFAPSLAYLLLARFSDRKALVLAGMGGLGLLGLGALWAIGFDFAGFLRHLGSGSVDFLQPFGAVGGNFPYPMFSLLHILDWTNALLLVVPFGLFVPAVILHYLPAEERWKSPGLIFLLIAAGCGLLFTWIINAALGMARDWDMLASFFVPLMVLNVALLAHPLVEEPRRYAIALVTTITLLHTAAFVAVNASAERHMARFKLLDSTTLQSLASQMAYNEALANYFFDNASYDEAKHYYQQYMQIDSMNPRILGNVSDVYRKLGEKESYFQVLKRAARLKNPNPGIYSNLGVEYASRGDTANAIYYNEQALIIEPNQPKAHANLGILYMSKKDFPTADRHFRTAIGLGMRDPVLFRYAGDVAVLVNDLPRAVEYYDRCLELAPGNARVRDARERIRAAIQHRVPD